MPPNPGGPSLHPPINSPLILNIFNRCFGWHVQVRDFYRHFSTANRCRAMFHVVDENNAQKTKL
jgi:hypothetical protein